MSAAQEARLQAIVSELATDMEAFVKDVEGSMPTTQNHYGRYLQFLLKAAPEDKNLRNVYVLALLEAGANRQGVMDALRQFG